MKELSEDTVVGLSLRSLAAIAGGVAVLATGWFTLQADIARAKEMPEPLISRTEYDLKDELIRSTIMNTQSDVEDIKSQLNKIEDRLFQVNAK